MRHIALEVEKDSSKQLFNHMPAYIEKATFEKEIVRQKLANLQNIMDY